MGKVVDKAKINEIFEGKDDDVDRMLQPKSNHKPLLLLVVSLIVCAIALYLNQIGGAIADSAETASAASSLKENEFASQMANMLVTN